VDQLDAFLFEKDEQLVELLGVDGVIGQIIVDLAIGQVALFLALLEQGLQAVVDLLHQTLPREQEWRSVQDRQQSARLGESDRSLLCWSPSAPNRPPLLLLLELP